MIVDFFKSVKTKIIGFVTAQSAPQGATVSLNGKPLSVTDFFPIEVVAGEYTLEIAKNGYRQETRPVTVVAGEILSLVGPSGAANTTAVSAPAPPATAPARASNFFKPWPTSSAPCPAPACP